MNREPGSAGDRGISPSPIIRFPEELDTEVLTLDFSRTGRNAYASGFSTYLRRTINQPLLADASLFTSTGAEYQKILKLITHDCL